MAPGGRSTGCRTCRMRHLKCDEGRPTCQRCEKAGVECRGYDVIDIFVDERSRIHERGTKSKPGQRTLMSGSLSYRSKGSAKSSRKNSPARSSSSLFAQASSTPPTEAIIINHYMAPVAQPAPPGEDDVFLNFMRHEVFQRPTIFNAEFGTLIATSLATPRIGWLAPALTQLQLKPPLEPAVNALTRAWYGKLKGHPDVAARGMIQYGKALSELKVALSQDSWRERDVLICSMCLILYEALVLTEEDAWVNHARGLGQLVEAQGPESFQDLVGIGILRAVRQVIIMSALARKVPTFLEKVEWRSVPWEIYPSAKDDNDYLFEIFATATGLMQRINLWETDQADEDPTEILQCIVSSLHVLCEWRWKYEADRPNCAWIEDLLEDEPSDIFPLTLQFATLYDAQVIGHFEALLVLFLWLVSRLKVPHIVPDLLLPSLLPNTIKHNPLILPGVDSLDLRAIAREICHTVRFRMGFAVASADNSVAFSLFLPIRMAWNVLKDSPLEKSWLEGVASELERSSGVQFSKLVFWARYPSESMDLTP